MTQMKENGGNISILTNTAAWRQVICSMCSEKHQEGQSFEQNQYHDVRTWHSVEIQGFNKRTRRLLTEGFFNDLEHTGKPTAG